MPNKPAKAKARPGAPMAKTVPWLELAEAAPWSAEATAETVVASGRAAREAGDRGGMLRDEGGRGGRM